MNSRTPQWVTRPAEGLLSSNNIGYSICKDAGAQKNPNVLVEVLKYKRRFD